MDDDDNEVSSFGLYDQGSKWDAIKTAARYNVLVPISLAATVGVFGAGLFLRSRYPSGHNIHSYMLFLRCGTGVRSLLLCFFLQIQPFFRSLYNISPIPIVS